jgi:hypothetical protein
MMGGRGFGMISLSCIILVSLDKIYFSDFYCNLMKGVACMSAENHHQVMSVIDATRLVSWSLTCPILLHLYFFKSNNTLIFLQ